MIQILKKRTPTVCVNVMTDVEDDSLLLGCSLSDSMGGNFDKELPMEKEDVP
jgi:hypothetical protein